MNVITAPASDTAMKDLLALIGVVEDPARYKASIAELNEATQQATAAVAETNAKLAELETREKELAAGEAIVAKSEGSIAKAQADLGAREQKLADEKVTLMRGQTALTEDRKAFKEASDKAARELLDRESAVSEREAKASRANLLKVVGG